MNPCPCGFAGDPVKECRCNPAAITRYQKRISGPLLDRIDIHLDVPRIDYDRLSERRPGEPSSAVREKGRSGPGSSGRSIRRDHTVYQCRHGTARTPPPRRTWTRPGEALMKAAVQQLHLSARAYHRVLKLARTIADLTGVPRSSQVTLPKRSSIGAVRRPSCCSVAESDCSRSTPPPGTDLLSPRDGHRALRRDLCPSTSQC